MRMRILFVACLVWIVLSSVQAHEQKKPVNASALRLEAARIFEHSFTRDLRLSEGQGEIELAVRELFEDDGPASGHSYQKPENRETVTSQTWIKKELLIPNPQAWAAHLVVLSDAPVEALISGIAQNLRPNQSRRQLHQRYAFDPNRLQAGRNEIILRVALQGADYNSIQAAVDAAQPGAEIVVENGTYTESIWIAKAKLTLRSASKHGAKIVAPQKRDAFGLGQDANYITLDGFDITAPGGTGVTANQTGIKHVLNHHTIVRNCYIHDCGGGGIQLNHGDYRTVEYNVVHRCALTGPWGQSGISLWQAIALDREPGFHIIVRGNILWDNSNPPNGTDGNGLIIDDFRNTQHGSTNGIYPNYTLVENNVAYHNGARGIHVFLSDHVILRNNTAYHNNWDNTNDATWRGELSCINSSDVKWYNNIAVASSAMNADNTAMMDGGGNQSTEWTGNLFFDSDKPTTPSVKISGGANRKAVLADNLVATDPQFVAPGTGADADFQLKGSSPAIGTAVAASASTTDVLGRTRDNRPDIGAYEFGARLEEPKYLIFWSSPEKAGELAERVGMKGDGKTRLLGFGLPNATYELEGQLPSRIRSAFTAAREHDMAVMLHFDFHLAWKNRPDLWNWFDPDKPGYNPNNKYNVEWHGWDGPPNKVRYLNHGVLERLPPNMCFTSKRTRGEITRIVSKIIGPVLREEISKLKAEGKEALFAGVLVGLEPSIDDYSKPNPECAKMMKEDGVPAGPLGYRALLDRGFSAENPPADFRQALAKIVQETVAFWCEQFVDAGIPAEKLYPHVAAPAPIEVMNAPIWTAFNEYSRPGWTTYAVMVLGENFQAIYDELEKHGNPAWAGVEANAGMPGSVVDWETYLGWHYNHGCVLVGVNDGATGEDLPKRLRNSAFGEEAIAAYRKFLTGEPLVEKPISLDHPQFRIQVKMKRVRAGIECWHSSGKDPSGVGKLMEGAQALANDGKLDELEKLVDQALEMLGETEKVPDVYRQE